MLAVTIPDRLAAEELGKTIALRGKAHIARRFNVALASWPQSGNMREFVGEVQEK
jgi:hypothetical protein